MAVFFELLQAKDICLDFVAIEIDYKACCSADSHERKTCHLSIAFTYYFRFLLCCTLPERNKYPLVVLLAMQKLLCVFRMCLSLRGTQRNISLKYLFGRRFEI